MPPRKVVHTLVLSKRNRDIVPQWPDSVQRVHVDFAELHCNQRKKDMIRLCWKADHHRGLAKP
jgi:hypothetical protein